MSSGSASDNTPSAPRAALTLRPMVAQDISFIMHEHLAHFPDNVMGRFGSPFLRRYYKTFLDTPYAVATVAVSEGRPCGYLVGILDTRAHRLLLRRRHGMCLFATALLGFLLHPRLARRLLARRFALQVQRLRQRREVSDSPGVAKVAVLSHVATVKDMRGVGVGQALVTDFVSTSRSSSADRVCLATLDGTAGAGGFYVRQGWDLKARRKTFDGRWILLFDLELHDDA